MNAYLRHGAYSDRGKKTRNDDCVAASAPTPDEFLARGALFAIADGVSKSEHGDRAAQYAVRGILNDFYATPETWATPKALDKIIAAQNRWLRWQRQKGDDSIATTLSLLAISGNRYCIAHVGDTRIYHWHHTATGDSRLSCLTTDHVWNHPELSHVLTRALGLDNTVNIDYYEGSWQAGDIFLLICDGIWSQIAEHELLRFLSLYAADFDNNDPALCARKICEAALAAGSQDNVSALVLQCLETVPDTLQQHQAFQQLPVPPRLKVGQEIDGFIVDEILHTSRETLVYRVHHPNHDGIWVLKTLTPLAAQDEKRRQTLHQEAWLTARMPSRHFVEMLTVPTHTTNYLYLVQRFYPGATLARRKKLGHHYSSSEVVKLGIQLLRALGSLHRLQVVHRDIKPENLHLGSDGTLRILDLGVAWCASHDESRLPSTLSHPGTPSYMAPELFSTTIHDIQRDEYRAQADLYATGVTLYYLLSGAYPYGEIEPFQRPRFGDPVPVTHYRHDIPLWLDEVLLKACARDPAKRFETAEEFLLALERGENHGLIIRRQSPLLERNPAGLWCGIALIAIVMNIFLLYLLLVS